MFPFSVCQSIKTIDPDIKSFGGNASFLLRSATADSSIHASSLIKK
jgi:hypothetical protein